MYNTDISLIRLFKQMEYTLLLVVFCLVFGVFWSFDSLLCLFLALFICVLYDSYNIWRRLCLICFYKIRRRFQPKKLMDVNDFKVLCLPSDVDINMHLTEGRLLQECTLAHTKLWTENFVYDALNSRGATVRVGGQYICYKYPIKLFESFEIISQILSWDETALYVSQTVLRYSDKCLCATVLSVHHLVGTTMSALLGVKHADFQIPEHEIYLQNFEDFHSTYFDLIQTTWKNL